ncbi:MAG: ParM/StbA family protein [Nitritalea sp.]
MKSNVTTLHVPSVHELNGNALRFVAENLKTGLKIEHQGKYYLVGDLALSEGLAPYRNINSAPDELDYNLLLKSSLVLANQKLGNPLTVTTGFPFSTYQIFKDQAKDKLQRNHEIGFDAATFSNSGLRKVIVEVDACSIMPEAIGCATGVRRMLGEENNFFMISLGYGTCEGILSMKNGLVQRSSLSTFGVRYAVQRLEAELSKQHYLALKNEHQIENNFKDRFIFINRKRVDLTALREQLLHEYYDEVISPALRRAFNDEDFQKSSKMYLGGGGALLPELVDKFKQEFADIIPVEVAPEASSLASIGYYFNSLDLSGGDASKAVGIDIGNASTVVTFSGVTHGFE